MTEAIKQWIQHTSLKYSNTLENRLLFSAGLEKGIEIAEGFAVWVVKERYVWDHDKRKYVAAWNNYWEATTSQLLEKYLLTLENK